MSQTNHNHTILQSKKRIIKFIGDFDKLSFRKFCRISLADGCAERGSNAGIVTD